MRVSQADIAQMAGVSKMTVSLALRDNPRIAPDTKMRIKALAEKHGYRSVPVLSRLAQKRFRTGAEYAETIAFIYDSSRGLYSWDARGLARCEESALPMGYNVEGFDIKNFRAPERLADILQARGIVGLIVGQIFSPDFVERFSWSEFCVVACGSGYFMPPTHLVVEDEGGARLRCWQEAKKYGYTRPGILDFLEPPSPRLDSLKRGASLMIQHEANVPDEFLYRCNKGASQANLIDWLNRYKPDVIIGATTFFYDFLKECRISIPFVTCYFAPDNKHVSGTRTSRRLLMKTALDLLENQLVRNHYGPSQDSLHILAPFYWQDGQTLQSPA